MSFVDYIFPVIALLIGGAILYSIFKNERWGFFRKMIGSTIVLLVLYFIWYNILQNWFFPDANIFETIIFAIISIVGISIGLFVLYWIGKIAFGFRKARAVTGLGTRNGKNTSNGCIPPERWNPNTEQCEMP